VIEEVEVEVELRSLTREEQIEVSQAIAKMPANKLGPVIEMCTRSGDRGEEDVVEINILKLNMATQRELQRYVLRHALEEETEETEEQEEAEEDEKVEEDEGEGDEQVEEEKAEEVTVPTPARKTKKKVVKKKAPALRKGEAMPFR
jgi:outer membrane biosynthesis protein TonB